MLNEHSRHYTTSWNVRSCRNRRGHGGLADVRRLDSYWLARPSIRSPSRSAWPLCRGYSSADDVEIGRRAVNGSRQAKLNLTRVARC